jgi:hypothetical protein
MKIQRRLQFLALGLALTLTTGLQVAAEPAPGGAAQHVTGNLVNIVGGARRSVPFSLTIDRYASQHDVDKMLELLAQRGPRQLRDALWEKRAGTLEVGGGLGYPVAVAFLRDTPKGRDLEVVFNRPLSAFEVSHGTRSSHYPFSVIQLNLDGAGNGSGVLIGAARLTAGPGTLTVQSLGTQPLRLLAVRVS